MVTVEVQNATLTAKWCLGVINHARDRLEKSYVFGDDWMPNLLNELGMLVGLTDELGCIEDAVKDTWVKPEMECRTYTHEIIHCGEKLDKALAVIRRYVIDNDDMYSKILTNSFLIRGYDIDEPIDYTRVYDGEDYPDYRKRILTEKIRALDIYHSMIRYHRICDTKYDVGEDGEYHEDSLRRGVLVFGFECLPGYDFFLEVKVDDDDNVSYDLVNIKNPNGWQEWMLSDEDWENLVHKDTTEYKALVEVAYNIFEEDFKELWDAGYLP